MSGIDSELHYPTPEDTQGSLFPAMVVLDITNACTLSCVHCVQPTMRVQPGYKARKMPLPTFKKIADEIAVHPGTVMRILGDGEPLVVKELPAMIEYAKDKGIKPIGITTAGYHLTEAMSRRFLAAGIDYIDFSLDAASKEVYDQIRVGSDYHRVMTNIERFLDLRKEIQSDPNFDRNKTKVLVNMIDQPAAHHEVADFFKLWAHRVDRVFVRPLHSLVNLKESANPSLDTDIPRWPCRYLWERVEITPTGNVMHCSQAWGRESAIVGNANFQSVSEIWNGPTMQTLRQNHLSNSFPEGSLCGPCRDWRVVRWDPLLSYSHQVKELTQ